MEKNYELWGPSYRCNWWCKMPEIFHRHHYRYTWCHDYTGDRSSWCRCNCSPTRFRVYVGGRRPHFQFWQFQRPVVGNRNDTNHVHIWNRYLCGDERYRLEPVSRGLFEFQLRSLGRGVFQNKQKYHVSQRSLTGRMKKRMRRRRGMKMRTMRMRMRRRRRKKRGMKMRTMRKRMRRRRTTRRRKRMRTRRRKRKRKRKGKKMKRRRTTRRRKRMRMRTRRRRRRRRKRKRKGKKMRTMRKRMRRRKRKRQTTTRRKRMRRRKRKRWTTRRRKRKRKVKRMRRMTKRKKEDEGQFPRGTVLWWYYPGSWVGCLWSLGSDSSLKHSRGTVLNSRTHGPKSTYVSVVYLSLESRRSHSIPKPDLTTRCYSHDRVWPPSQSLTIFRPFYGKIWQLQRGHRLRVWPVRIWTTSSEKRDHRGWCLDPHNVEPGGGPSLRG